jgi:hypothetical protein
MVRPCRAERAVPHRPGKPSHEIYPALANQYLSLALSQRAASLASSVDPLPFSQAQAQSLPGSPTDIDTIKYFASPDDICRAFAGLQHLAAQPKLTLLGPILSAGGGGLGLDPAQWPHRLVQGRLRARSADPGLSGRQQQRPHLRGGRDAQRPGNGPVPVGPGGIVGNCPGRLRAGPVTPARAGAGVPVEVYPAG